MSSLTDYRDAIITAILRDHPQDEEAFIDLVKSISIPEDVLPTNEKEISKEYRSPSYSMAEIEAEGNLKKADAHYDDHRALWDELLELKMTIRDLLVVVVAERSSKRTTRKTRTLQDERILARASKIVEEETEFMKELQGK